MRGKDIEDLSRDAGQFVKDLRGNAASWKGVDDEYGKELEQKADIIDKGLMPFSDLAELFGTLKLRKGSW